jgi:hypothetical protein
MRVPLELQENWVMRLRFDQNNKEKAEYGKNIIDWSARQWAVFFKIRRNYGNCDRRTCGVREKHDSPAFG